jgi:dTDP-glucose 4,6-dehydratase
MKTIIVTGGLGFIGSNLINILSKKNFFIINIDKETYASNFKKISSNIKN